MRKQVGSVLIEFAVFLSLAGLVLLYSWGLVLKPKKTRLEEVFYQRLKYDGEIQWKN